MRTPVKCHHRLSVGQGGCNHTAATARVRWYESQTSHTCPERPEREEGKRCLSPLAWSSKGFVGPARLEPGAVEAMP